jgi:hypothetical protein
MTDNGGELTIGPVPSEFQIADSMAAGDISFVVNGYGEVVKIKGNGDIFVKGNLVTNDMEVVEGFKEFFGMSKSYNNAWYDTAAQMSRNADYYRGLVVQIGQMFGAEAYISDDGSVQDDVLCAKVPEMVAARLGLKLENNENNI